MRFWLTSLSLMAFPFALATALSAQAVVDQQAALREAKAKAAAAERRSEVLRQEASYATEAADRLIAQRAVLGAEMDAATAQIAAANARMAIIAERQIRQRSQLGIQSEPILRLNAALQQMTGRPAALLMAQPGTRADYIHLRAVMATVEPIIRKRTAALRGQIVEQKELRGQELLAMKSLGEARTRLSTRRSALAALEGDSRNKAGELSAVAAVEFEQAIAQGERARDLVASIDTSRMSGEKAQSLAGLDGPLLREPISGQPVPAGNTVYTLPAGSKLVFGFNELNATGYRERGVRLALSPSASIRAPAAGKISFAGNYRSYGQIVIIEHGGGWTTLITNLASLSVAEGASVVQGSVLGKARADQPEITMELRRKGRVMDLAALL
jgi:murein hydrolase activator